LKFNFQRKKDNTVYSIVVFLDSNKPTTAVSSTTASDEENKSTTIKKEFLNKVSERVKDEAGAAAGTGLDNRSPSSSSMADRENAAAEQPTIQQQQSLDLPLPPPQLGSDIGQIPKSASGQLIRTEYLSIIQH
jgi:hypothetical protein